MSFLGHNRTRPGAPSSLCHPDTTGEIASSRPWSSSLAGSRDKSGEEAESRLGECSECNSLAQEEGEGGGESWMVLPRRCERSRQDEEVERQ